MTERGRAVRRIMGVLAAGALAVVGVSACSTAAGSPGTAAQVGNVRITTAQVDSAVGDAQSIVATRAQLEQQYVADEVYLQLLQKYAAQQHIPLTAPTSDTLTSVAQAYQTTTSNQLVVAEASAFTDAQTIAGKITPVTPTESELRQSFDRAVKAGLAAPDSYSSFKEQIVQVPEFGTYIALQRQLANIAKENNVVINPRYTPLCDSPSCAGLQVVVLSLSNGQNAFDSIVLPIGPAPTPAVIDLPTTAG